MNTLSPGEGCRLGSSLERVRVVDAQGRPRPGGWAECQCGLKVQENPGGHRVGQSLMHRNPPVLVLDRRRPPVRRDTSEKCICLIILEKRHN